MDFRQVETLQLFIIRTNNTHTANVLFRKAFLISSHTSKTSISKLSIPTYSININQDQAIIVLEVNRMRVAD